MDKTTDSLQGHTYLLVYLPKKDYFYYELHFTYTSDAYYDAAVTFQKDGFGVQFNRKKFDTPIEVSNYDTLYQPAWKGCRAYGILDAKGEPVAFLELYHEGWNNRMRITQLLVREQVRRQGMGRFLIDAAKKKAKQAGCRHLVLEAQSNNVPALDFYFSQGFVFGGTNLYFYTNDDIGEREVMLELVAVL